MDDEIQIHNSVFDKLSTFLSICNICKKYSDCKLLRTAGTTEIILLVSFLVLFEFVIDNAQSDQIFSFLLNV